jgi:capsular polysaccharide biosynthesis protein
MYNVQKEVIMKKLLLIAIVATLPTIASAAISVENATNPEYLKNNGFSTKTTEMVSISKARANSQEYYTDDETAFQKENKFVKFWRKFYVYADPAAEDYSFYHHDTDSTPTYTDL